MSPHARNTVLLHAVTAYRGKQGHGGTPTVLVHCRLSRSAAGPSLRITVHACMRPVNCVSPCLYYVTCVPRLTFERYVAWFMYHARGKGTAYAELASLHGAELGFRDMFMRNLWHATGQPSHYRRC